MKKLISCEFNMDNLCTKPEAAGKYLTLIEIVQLLFFFFVYSEANAESWEYCARMLTCL